MVSFLLQNALAGQKYYLSQQAGAYHKILETTAFKWHITLET